jgi:hypothetical protein
MTKVLLSCTLVATLFLASCGGGSALTETQLNAMADSMAAPKIEEMEAKATADCEARMVTEVKSMVDSMARAK